MDQSRALLVGGSSAAALVAVFIIFTLFTQPRSEPKVETAYVEPPVVIQRTGDPLCDYRIRNFLITIEWMTLGPATERCDTNLTVVEEDWPLYLRDGRGKIYGPYGRGGQKFGPRIPDGITSIRAAEGTFHVKVQFVPLGEGRFKPP